MKEGIVDARTNAEKLILFMFYIFRFLNNFPDTFCWDEKSCTCLTVGLAEEVFLVLATKDLVDSESQTADLQVRGVEAHLIWRGFKPTWRLALKSR